MKYRGPRWPRRNACRECGNRKVPLYWVPLVDDWLCYEHREALVESGEELAREIYQQWGTGR